MSRSEQIRAERRLAPRHVIRKGRRNTIIRVAAMIVFVGALIALVLISAPSAGAATPTLAASKSVDLPGVDICAKDAPFAATPDSGLAGLVGERPLQITTDDTPEHIWTTGGFAGMRSHSYDLGCALDPTSWMRIANANTDNTVTNTITSLSDAIVSVTDAVDRRAWQPQWVTTFLGDFVSDIMARANAAFVIPLAGLGLMVATLLLIRRSSEGKVGETANGVGWTIVVLFITTFLVAAPLFVSSLAQKATGVAVAGINNGINPSDAATNQIVKNVQYQGFLRRNFGSSASDTATTYGPALLASTRVSWAELDAINSTSPSARPQARANLQKEKEEQFKKIAAKVKDSDETAYKYLTGEESSSTETLVEVGFTLSSSLFRLMTSILMITCRMVLILLGILWVISTPILFLPRAFGFSGQDMGMGMINSSVKAVVFVIQAAIGSWVFGIFLQFALAPGITLWWSLLLLILGSGIAWTVIRPDRKFLSIVSLGRVNGYGYVGSLLQKFAWAYIGGRIGGRAAGREIAEAQEEQPQPQPVVTVDDPQPRPVVYADVYNPTPAFVPEQATHVDGEPLTGRIIPALPSGTPVYERPTPAAEDRPAPPPDGAASPYVPYERTDDNEGANA